MTGGSPRGNFASEEPSEPADLGPAFAASQTDTTSLKQADLAMFTLDEPRFSGAGDPLAALVLCGAHRADRVMVGGKWRVVGGEIVGLDLGGLMARHRAAARRLTA